MDDLRPLFLLDPDVVFLNHGSFGARPRPVFEAYQQWQRELERQPVAFLARRWFELLGEVRRDLATYVNCGADDLVLVPNATFGVNIVARSLPLAPGDEILTTNHEYGACDRTWRFLCGRREARYVRRHVPLPVAEEEAIVEAIWAGVTPRTRLIFLSHITSPTALCLPVAEICARARAAGILTLIDGAHVPGQIPLDLERIGADFYAGNCHKWLMAPPGSAFLYARPEHQSLLAPLVVSWGWESEWETELSSFQQLFGWIGTLDPAAYLAIPAAIRFQEQYDWNTVRARCHGLALQAQTELACLTGLPPLYPETFFAQMVAVALPAAAPRLLQQQLYEKFRVEVPVLAWEGHTLLRLSVQGYNRPADISVLVQALDHLLS